MMLSPSFLFSQSLLGAWESNFIASDGIEYKNVVIFSDGFQVATEYNKKTGAFKRTNGGSWSLNENTVTEGVEFHSENSNLVGTTVSFEIELSENELRIVGLESIWKRIDHGTPGNLAGAWFMSERMRDGKLQSRDTHKPRKTMKILSGTRFQWIAYNTETKQFMATGGGTYTTVNGKYTENIEFFSRDSSRVGASLDFNYSLEDGAWHHSGLSSKGKPIYEVWSLRE